MMNNILLKSLLTTPALLGASLVALPVLAETASVPANRETLQQVRSYSSAVSTNETLQQVRSYSSDSNEIGQVTSVTQLSDVQPTDWAYQSLQSLVERYGCLVGYPDGTFRGNRPLSRYEFAAGLNACMDRVNELIAKGVADTASKSDLETLRRLQEEFAAELAGLRQRVDVLEERTNTLEAQQFSTTTKLEGSILFTLAGVIDGDDLRSVGGTGAPNPANRTGENTIFGYRGRLSFNTSFTGKDRLRTRLQFGNLTAFNTGITGTNMTRLGADGGDGTIELDDLTYRFPIFGTGRLTIAAKTEFDRVFDTVSLLENSDAGALSRFGRFNPIYRTGSGAGAILDYKFSDAFSATVGYLAANGSNPTVNNGLLGGTYSALGQVTIKPFDSFKIGFAYARVYYPNGSGFTGSTGSSLANAPFGGIASEGNNYSGLVQWDLSKTIGLSGWFNYLDARASTGATAQGVNWAAQLAVKDMIRKGDLAGIVFGQPPQRTGGSVGPEGNTTSYHIEAFYRYQMSDNIQVTPGIIIITSPEHNSRNDTQYVGVIRTRFSF